MNTLILNTFRDLREDNTITVDNTERAVEKLVQQHFDTVIFTREVGIEDENKIKALLKKINHDTVVLRQATEELETTVAQAKEIWKNINRQQLAIKDIFSPECLMDHIQTA